MILCADDYGFRADIDAAILELCGSGRLSAVSCLAALERCQPAALEQLRAHESRVDIGLHLCLADETLPRPDWAAIGSLPPCFPAYGVYLRRSLSRRINTREAAAQVSAQYALFLKKCGRRPDFIDGHLYVHQLPGVRQALIAFALSLPANCRPYIRNTRPPLRRLGAAASLVQGRFHWCVRHADVCAVACRRFAHQ